jgi:hypothetical protein
MSNARHLPPPHVQPGRPDRAEVSPFEARLPLRSPSAVSLKAKLRIERSEGGTFSAPCSALGRGLTSCPTYRTARPRPQRVQATPREPDSLHAKIIVDFLKKENTPCQKKTKLSSVVCLKKFETRAICQWQTSPLPPPMTTITLRHPKLGGAPRLRRTKRSLRRQSATETNPYPLSAPRSAAGMNR